MAFIAIPPCAFAETSDNPCMTCYGGFTGPMNCLHAVCVSEVTFHVLQSRIWEVGHGRPRRLAPLRSSTARMTNRIKSVEDSIVVEVTEDNYIQDEDDDAASSLEGFPRLPINLDLNLYRAKCFRQKYAFAEAESVLRQCIKDWPCDGRPYVSLGKLLSKQGLYKEARAVYEDGCQAARGENAYIWQAWAILEEKCGDIRKARKLFDAATVADIKHAAAWHGWAMLELRQGNKKKARELLCRGIRYCGANEYLFQTLALMEYRAGKLDEARVLFSQAVECNPKSCASWLARALLEAEEDDSNVARYYFQKALEASPRNRYVFQAWALFEAKNGNIKQARKLFRQGHELNPKDGVLVQAFALFEYKYSHPDTARSLFHKASLLDPKHQPTWIAWGWMEWKENNLEKARELYKRSLAIDSQSLDAARTFHAWGVLEERDGNYALARELFKQALNVDSQNAVAWMSWAKLEENLDNAIRAEEIRNLYFQQRMEVIDVAGWDEKLSDIFAPAIDHIKSMLSMQPQMEKKEDTSESKTKTNIHVNMTNEEFDLDSFLEEKFPSRYNSPSKTSQSSTGAFSASQIDLFEYGG